MRGVGSRHVQTFLDIDGEIRRPGVKTDEDILAVLRERVDKDSDTGSFLHSSKIKQLSKYDKVRDKFLKFFSFSSMTSRMPQNCEP